MSTPPTTPASSPPSTPPKLKAEQSLGARIAARLGGGAMRVFLILVALFWIMPTIGLFLSSLRGPENIAATGWWKIFTAPPS